MIKAEIIKQLRERTGVGIMDCKKALLMHNGDLTNALNFLREKGISDQRTKINRAAAEGIIDAYIHGNGRIGVLLEVNIETDFAALSKEFKEFVKDVGMQIAAASPKYIKREDIPLDVVEQEKEAIRAQANKAGKDEKIVDRIIEGRMEKFYKDVCLLEQPFIKDTDISVKQLLNSKISVIGENIVIKKVCQV